MFKGTMTKWPVRKLTQGTTQKLLQYDAIDILKNFINLHLRMYAINMHFSEHGYFENQRHT